MNGGMSYPQGYSEFESAVERHFVSLARALSRAANRLIPGKRKAHLLLVANERTRAALPVDHQRVVTLVENGVDLSTFKMTDPSPPSAAGRIRLIFVGRLVDWKAVDVTLKALAEARARGIDATIDILGDGPERAGLGLLARELGLAEQVTFHGFGRRHWSSAIGSTTTDGTLFAITPQYSPCRSCWKC
jgi:glycosyltransferase involved in cell wall biosynthesis